MFKIKKPAIIGMLLILLVFTGYLNYQLTQQALLISSNDYKSFEEKQMAKNMEFVISDNSKESEPMPVSTDSPETVEEVVSASNVEMDNALNSEDLGTRNYFVEYRLSRDKLRAGIVDRLDNIVDNPQTAENTRNTAQDEIMKIGKVSEKELQIEGLIKSKGFEEAVVFLTDEDIKVVVSKNELSEQDVVKILDIVKSETTYSAQGIKIMNKQ